MITRNIQSTPTHFASNPVSNSVSNTVLRLLYFFLLISLLSTYAQAQNINGVRNYTPYSTPFKFSETEGAKGTEGTKGTLGAWTSGRFGGFFKIESRLLVGENWYNDEGEIVPIPQNLYLANSFYAEFGFIDRLDVILNIPFFVQNSQDAGAGANANVQNDMVSSIGDMIVGARFAILHNRPFALSATLLLGIPTGIRAKDNAFAATGDGEFNQLIQLEAGYSFYPTPVYIGVGAGFNNRTQNFSDELRFYAESGVHFLKRFYGKIAITGLIPLENGSAINRRFLYTLFQNNVGYLAYGAEVGGYIIKKKLGLGIGIDGAFSGRNVLATPAFYLGLFYQLERKAKEPATE